MSATMFDPIAYKSTTRAQWEVAAEPWHRYGATLERWLGEATDAMLDQAQIAPGSRVLDVAAGAGGQTLAAARRVGPAGQVLATDISPGILAFAEQAARAEGLEQVATRVADGERLELDDEGFDAAICRLGLIYFPDQQAALRGIGSALRPGGRLASIVYSTPEANRFFSIPVSIIRRRAALPAPLPGQPGPFSLGRPGAIEQTYAAAGFADVEVQVLEAPLRLPSAADCTRFERESFGALGQMLAGLEEDERADAWQEIEHELAQFEGPDGFAGPCELLIASGRRP
jgi:SAM-dependent methyltransferase